MLEKGHYSHAKGHTKYRKGITAKWEKGTLFLAVSNPIFLRALRPITRAPTAMAVDGRRLIRALLMYVCKVNTSNKNCIERSR